MIRLPPGSYTAGVSMEPLPTRSPRLLDRLQPSESTVLVGAAVVVGLLAAGGVWAFKRLIELTHSAAFDGLARGGAWTTVLLPAVGGLLVGLLVHFLIGHERHHGVAGIMEAVALGGGRLRYRRAPAKAVAAALAIGTGSSVGPEDPSVQIGANFGSFAGQRLGLSSDRVRMLVAAGAAAGIAAAFNAPIAGLFFALEIVLGDFGSRAFGAVVVAAVASSVLTRWLSGAQPAFDVPSYDLKSAWELPLYLGLGLCAGPIAAGYVRAIQRAKDGFAATRLPVWAAPAVAGLVVGLTALALPQVLGVGYETIEKTLAPAQMGALFLLAILVAKLVMTALCVGAGVPGGVFAPSLVLGAVLGAAFGQAAGAVFPGLGIAPPAFAMVGMAAVLAGTVHAPLTATLLLFEMTSDYRIILPLLFAVAVSLVVSKRLQADSVYTMALARRGIRLERGRDVEVLDGITVAEVMQADTATLRESDSLKQAADAFARSRHHGLPVVDASGALVGVLTVTDLERAESGAEGTPANVGTTCTRDLVLAYPDDTIAVALRRMAVRDIGRLPVVSRDDPRRLVGVLRRTDLVRAYDVALTRRATVRHRADQAKLGAFTGAAVEEFVVAPGASCAGRRVSDCAWPRDCVLASCRRGAQILVPNGNTVLQPGDVLVAVGDEEAQAQMRRLCGATGTVSNATS
jgi:CIC family chloride channel protein